MIAVKVLRPKALLAFSLAMMISLTTASQAFILLLSFSESLSNSLGGLEEGLIIMQEGAKSIYTSRVPASLAESLRRIEGVNAQAITLTPTTLKGHPIVVRGVERIDDYLEKIVEGEAPREEGSWILFGEKAFQRLGLRTGEIITLGSPSSTSIITLQISGTYRTDSLRDYEAIVPLEVGVELAGLPPGTISAIKVNGIDERELRSLMGALYNLTLINEAEGGYIIILDSLNIPVASLKLEGGRNHTLQLPFGYYTVIYREDYLTINLTSLLLRGDRAITLRTRGGKIYQLRVVAPEVEQPILRRGDNLTLQGRRDGEGWVFEAPLGLYTLILGGRSYLIPLIGDTSFNPTQTLGALERLRIRVQWMDGADVSDYLLTLRSPDGVLVASMICMASEASIDLPPGEYEAEVSKPPYLSRVRFRIPGEKVMVILPSASSPGRVPPRLFQQLKAVTPLDTSSTTLTSLTGLTTSSIITPILSLTILSIITVFTVQRGLYKSAEDNLKVFTVLGAGRGETLRIIWIKLLGLNMALGAASAYSASAIHGILISRPGFTVLGYGIEPKPLLTLIYSITLSILSWLLTLLRMLPKVEG